MKLTEFLAIYGACLSTVVFFWNLVRTRPRFKVKALTLTDEADPTRFAGADIFVQNVSTSLVHISSVWVLYPSIATTSVDRIKHVLRHRTLPLHVGFIGVRMQDFGLEDGCPTVLEPGKIHQVFVPREAFQELLLTSLRREIRVVAEDRFWGNREYSNILRIPVFKDSASLSAHDYGQRGT